MSMTNTCVATSESGLDTLPELAAPPERRTRLQGDRRPTRHRGVLALIAFKEFA
jgi:hypothetical protein